MNHVERSRMVLRNAPTADEGIKIIDKVFNSNMAARSWQISPPDGISLEELNRVLDAYYPETTS